MLILTFQVNCASWHIPGIKEAIAMLLERWGDVRLVDIREVQKAAPAQMSMENFTGDSQTCANKKMEDAGR